MIISAYFSNGGSPAEGLSPTLDSWLNDGTKVLDGVSMTEVSGGFYYYDFEDYDNSNNYYFRADGGNSLADHERYSYSANDLDQEVIAGAVWDENIRKHNLTNSAGRQLKKSGSAVFNAVWTSKERDRLIDDVTTLMKKLEEVTNEIESIKLFTKEESDSHKKNTEKISENITKSLDKKIKHLTEQVKLQNDSTKTIANSMIDSLNKKIYNLNQDVETFKEAQKNYLELQKELSLNVDIKNIENEIDKLAEILVKSMSNEKLEGVSDGS
jgi:hypothetical protein